MKYNGYCKVCDWGGGKNPKSSLGFQFQIHISVRYYVLARHGTRFEQTMKLGGQPLFVNNVLPPLLCQS